jgi:hypothetical protein
VFLFTFYQDWRGRGLRASANDRVRNGQSELDDGEDRMQSGETWWELQMVCTISDTSFDQIWAQTTVGELCGRSIGSDICSVDPYSVAWL